MAREFARSFYNSGAWHACRDTYKRQAGGLCEECLKRGVITPGVEVHHIKPVTPFNIGNPEITLNPDNLQLLCRDCHMDKHREMQDETRAGRKRRQGRYEVDPLTGRVETR